LAGEKVCIHAVTPMTESSELASRAVRRMASESVRTGFHTIRTGTEDEALSWLAISWDWAATCFRTSSPYRCWLPVRNQTS
jgi:hypothetical protein